MLLTLNNILARIVYAIQKFFIRTPIKLQKVASELTSAEKITNALLDDGKRWKPTLRVVMLMKPKDLVREGNLIIAGQSTLSRSQRDVVLWRLDLLQNFGAVNKHKDVTARINIPVK